MALAYPGLPADLRNRRSILAKLADIGRDAVSYSESKGSIDLCAWTLPRDLKAMGGAPDAVFSGQSEREVGDGAVAGYPPHLSVKVTAGDSRDKKHLLGGRDQAISAINRTGTWNVLASTAQAERLKPMSIKHCGEKV